MLAAFPDALVAEFADGWEDRWRDFHHAIEIGPLWVGPPWETPPAGALAVVVDPGRAFGTGAHPTTRLCLELLLDEERGSVVDVGCGSGVLSIAAIRLGHDPVVALDVDEMAVEVAEENARANAVELDARVLDARTGQLPEADLALANISFEAIELVGGRLETRRAITAGYLANDHPRLPGFAHLARRECDGWGADLFERLAR
ncbi:MAG TPA: 50S ribosomal protein L11 methyltransferase [Gaiellaceae bacterium]|nr:50S ribosomal protein L11 methyltransferase [Gaiellaceae bacterium]